MAYKAILERSQLPAEKQPLPEDLRFDMKMLNANVQIGVGDLAGDVAAFANTVGGVLLFGAHEHPRDSGILHTYAPISFSAANAVQDKPRSALDLCSPRPIAEAKAIALDATADKYVVAINCDPYTAPPIGVMLESQQGGAKHWSFPARWGRDNRPLRPEELATIMEPRLRRTLLLLDRLPRFDPGSIRRACFHSRHSSGDPPTYDIASISTEASSMRLRHTQFSHDVIVPLDAVRMIWQDTQRGMFHISLDGTLMLTENGIEFRPSPV